MASNIQQLLEVVERLGLTGADAINFIREQQELARAERLEAREEAERQRQEAERQRQEAELQRQEAEAQREHERDMMRFREEFEQNRIDRNTACKKAPKLPAFSENSDTIDSYLQRFERFAQANGWDREEWAVSLSALLTGKALDVYSRLSDDDATNYDRLKAALLKRYNLTEQGYREKFRKCRPEKEESPEQYIFRMQTYLEKWIELSKSEQSYEGLRDLIVKEQVIDSCPKELGIHLLERAPADLKELAQLADQYLKAHGKQLYRELKNYTKESKEKRDENFCTNCKKPGHKTAECRWLNKDRNNSPKCFNCDKYGHIRNDWLNSSSLLKQSSSKSIIEDTHVACTSGLLSKYFFSILAWNVLFFFFVSWTLKSFL